MVVEEVGCSGEAKEVDFFSHGRRVGCGTRSRGGFSLLSHTMMRSDIAST